MLRKEAEALRDAAAEKTRQRMERDRNRASSTIAPLLAHLEEHLFDPELRYERMREIFHIRDNNRATLFRHDVGLTPAAYIRDCRFEVACRLLRDTELDVARIGSLVGYDGPNVFGAAFRRWAGMTPATYRRTERTSGAATQEGRADLPDLSPAAWRRFVEGELEKSEADRLLRFLLDLYPDSRRHLVRELLRQVHSESEGDDEKTLLVPSLRSMFARDDIERMQAEVLWEDMHRLPWSEQRDLVRHHQRFSTAALVDFLLEKSREEGRRERVRGVEIARLALEAASAQEGVGNADGTSSLKAVAWAWLGNAKRLALDFAGADQAFEAARRLLPKDAPGVQGELLVLQATLCRWQRRFQEALELADRGLPLLRENGRHELLARGLLLRGIVRRELGDLPAAVADNEAALALLDLDRDRALILTARFNLSRCLVELSSPVAEQAVTEVRALAEEMPDLASATLSVEWLEGLLAASQGQWERAQRRLEEAKDRLLESKREAAAAVLNLDLAWVYLRCGDRIAARRLVEEALPMFESLAFCDEQLAATILRDDAREIAERLQEMMALGVTSRSLQALRAVACRVADASWS